jgi:L-2,4-diaminobutyrate decarboxylase
MPESAYDPEAFRALGHRLIDRLADYLGAATSGASPVLPPSVPEDLMAAFPSDFPESSSGESCFLSEVDRILEASHRLHHPHFVGHQVSAPLPQAALSDLISSLLNNGMAVFEMGPSATAMERAVLRWMADLAGWPAAEGHLTSGGSIGNLGALLTARQIMARLDTEGRAAIERPAMLISEQAHYCGARAAHVMGWGREGLLAVDTDDRFRLRPEKLGEALLEARRRGREPIAVFASSCSTSTGSYDPLPAIADFCAEEKLWLHVDGAHGASALLSPQLRHLLTGIERADSLVWDAHKMLAMPALLTGVLFRNPSHASAALAQKASYLFDRDPDEEWYNAGHRTLECTKTMMGMKLWLALRSRGVGFFRDHVESRHALARNFARELEAAPDFELAVMPESNIVCFRHLGAEDLDARQAQVRAALIASERFYLTQTRLRDDLWLRTTLINPLTTEADLADLLESIRRIT